MCGIGGIVVLGRQEAQPNAEQLVEQMIATMHHRGPDHSGIELLGNACLGACRLTVLGLGASSNQPLHSPDSSCVVVYNGEVYNYRELRTQLLELGHRFVSSGDTEVLIHAYEEWGAGCLPRIDGMFAFVVYDSARGEIFFARDRFGVKPLYYSVTESRFVFASEPKALVLTGCVTKELDSRSVIDYLRFGITDADDRTFFRWIRQLPPGHFGRICGGRMLLTEWYGTPRLDRKSTNHDDTAVHEFYHLLEDSVKLRLRSDVPVGVLLSGGLDSSAIASLAARQTTDPPLQAFTATFPGSKVDEARYARQVAESFGLALTTRATESMDAQAVRTCVSAQGEPMISPSVVAQWLVMQAAHQRGIRVLLSGQGADEYLCGYEYFDAYAVNEMIRQRQWTSLVDHVVKLASPRRILRVLLESAFLRMPAFLKGTVWHRKWLNDSEHPIDECDYWDSFKRTVTLLEVQTMHLRRRLPELLRYEDRNSMAFSIETRHPFLDFRLVECVLSMDSRELVAGGVRKRILRRSMVKVLPQVVLNRRDKIGFQTPDEWLRSERFRDAVRQLLDSPPVPLRAFVDFEAIARIVRGIRWRLHIKDLWRIYNLLLWYREIVTQTVALRG